MNTNRGAEKMSASTELVKKIDHKHEWVESGFGRTYKARCSTCNYIRGTEQARLNGLELDPTGEATWRVAR